MDLQLKGKKAVVTGASRGIGWSIAELLADEGCDVAVCARGQDGVDAAVKALEAKGVKAWGRAVDIADGPAITGFVKDAAKELGGLDILIRRPSPIWKRPPALAATRPSSSPRRCRRPKPAAPRPMAP